MSFGRESDIVEKVIVIKNFKIPLIQLILGGVIIVFLVFTIPQVSNFMKVSKVVTEKKAILAKLDEGIRNMSVRKKEIEEMDFKNKNYMSKLTYQEEFAVVLELFSQEAKKNNVKIIAIEPQAQVEDPAKFYVKVPVFIDAICNYHSLGKFLSSLESASRFVKVETLRLDNDGADPLVHQVFLRVDAFCLKGGAADALIN